MCVSIVNQRGGVIWAGCVKSNNDVGEQCNYLPGPVGRSHLDRLCLRLWFPSEARLLRPLWFQSLRARNKPIRLKFKTCQAEMMSAIKSENGSNK